MAVNIVHAVQGGAGWVFGMMGDLVRKHHRCPPFRVNSNAFRADFQIFVHESPRHSRGSISSPVLDSLRQIVTGPPRFSLVAFQGR